MPFNTTSLDRAQHAVWYYLRLIQTHLEALRLSISNRDQPTIVFLGDSRARAWPAPSELSDFKFVNLGISLETSDQTKRRLNTHIPPLCPEIVVIQVGVNDLKPLFMSLDDRERIVSRARENIEQIAKRLANTETTVILTTIFPVWNGVQSARIPFWPPAVVQSIEEINHYICSLAFPNLIIIDAYSILVSERGFIKDRYARDHWHTNALGYRVLNEELVPLLAPFKTKKQN